MHVLISSTPSRRISIYLCKLISLSDRREFALSVTGQRLHEKWAMCSEGREKQIFEMIVVPFLNVSLSGSIQTSKTREIPEMPERMD